MSWYFKYNNVDCEIVIINICYETTFIVFSRGAFIVFFENDSDMLECYIACNKNAKNANVKHQILYPSREIS